MYHCAPSRMHRLAAPIRRQGSSRHFPCNTFCPLPHVRGFTPLHSPVDAVSLGLPSDSPHRPLGRVRLDAEVSKIVGEIAPPLPKGRLSDVKPRSLFANRLNDQM